MKTLAVIQRPPVVGRSMRCRLQSWFGKPIRQFNDRGICRLLRRVASAKARATRDNRDDSAIDPLLTLMTVRFWDSFIAV